MRPPFLLGETMYKQQLNSTNSLSVKRYICTYPVEWYLIGAESELEKVKELILKTETIQNIIASLGHKVDLNLFYDQWDSGSLAVVKGKKERRWLVSTR